ncbi:MAG: hypothetical protein P9M07_07400 [Candidatus Aceula meridiana]|nr:hypothetical protein [Candidatus Aceula meridiana]
MTKIIRILLCLCFIVNLAAIVSAAEESYTIFDDKSLLEGYAKKYAEEPKKTLIAMIRDDTLAPYKTAAAIRVFNKNFSQIVFSREKKLIEKWLLRRFARTDSIFVEIEVLHTLCKLDRYKYFKSMIPNLIRRMDHYNKTANELAYNYILDVIQEGQGKSREARIVFNMIRKMLFLSRKKLKNITEPGERLKQKIELLRWSVKILGTEELKRLPPEVLHLF